MGVRLSDQVAWREIDGETYVVDLRAKKIYGLNPPGGRIWHELAKGSDGEGLEGASTFLAELETAGLITSDATHACSPTGSALSADFVPPRVVWQEQLQSFGFSCARIEGQSPACDQVPTT